ncbi:MAG TPA: hypothetical protein VE476_10965 [Propionibacteriaceae bacterium]|nr:hypothetical protein [Propionibacteriaceae bacterium]
MSVLGTPGRCPAQHGPRPPASTGAGVGTAGVALASAGLMLSPFRRASVVQHAG